jgi:hypothetical protein
MIIEQLRALSTGNSPLDGAESLDLAGGNATQVERPMRVEDRRLASLEHRNIGLLEGVDHTHNPIRMHGWNCKEIDRNRFLEMAFDETVLCLRKGFWVAHPIPGNCCLRRFDAEQDQFPQANSRTGLLGQDIPLQQPHFVYRSCRVLNLDLQAVHGGTHVFCDKGLHSSQRLAIRECDVVSALDGRNRRRR